MQTLPKLSAVESMEVGKFLDQLEKRINYKQTLEGLIFGWEQFVNQVVTGYPVGIYDYKNDLSLRTIIHTLFEAVPTLKETLESIVNPIDDLFIQHTRISEKLSKHNSIAWWDNRIPIKVEGELKIDFEERGIV